MTQTTKLMNGQFDSPLRFQSPEHRPSPLKVPGGLSPEKENNVNEFITPRQNRSQVSHGHECLQTPESVVSSVRQSNRMRKSNTSAKLPRVALLGEKWAQEKKDKMKAEGRELAKTPKTPYTPRTPSSLQSPSGYQAFATTPGTVHPTTPSKFPASRRNTQSKNVEGTQKMKAKRSPKPSSSPQKQQIKRTSATKVSDEDKKQTAAQKHIERIRKSHPIQKGEDVSTPRTKSRNLTRLSPDKVDYGHLKNLSSTAQVFSQNTSHYHQHYEENVNAITPTEHENLPNSSGSTNTNDSFFPSPPRDEMMIDTASIIEMANTNQNLPNTSFSELITQHSLEMSSAKTAHEEELAALQSQVDALEQTMKLHLIENEAIQSEVNRIRIQNEENMNTVKRGSELMMNELRKRNERISLHMQSIPTQTPEEKDEILTNLFVSLSIMLKLQFSLENRQTYLSVTDLYNEIRLYPVEQWSERIYEALCRPKPFQMEYQEMQWV
ncbi:hypothetical protein BLNAU_233 [Blattamonas nauphoetae]|uniref:Uncharacterized protein n=1 Tax=Blattamonas nauphoetae TaxID=2049346 RepID=A0ABQ9YMG3_9EUKA|nr:hypothetical protein BLNAU_233 [Blattamonas nauphoetae]